MANDRSGCEQIGKQHFGEFTFNGVILTKTEADARAVPRCLFVILTGKSYYSFLGVGEKTDATRGLSTLIRLASRILVWVTCVSLN